VRNKMSQITIYNTIMEFGIFFKKYKKNIFWFVCGLFLGSISTFLVSRGYLEEINFQIDSGNQHIDVSLKGKKNIGYDSLLTKMFADDFMQASILTWLNKKDIYAIDSPLLAKRLSKLPYDCDLSDDIRNLSYKKVGPFVYIGERMKFIKVSNRDIPDGEAYVCYNCIYAGKDVGLTISNKTIRVSCIPKFDCPENNKSRIELRKRDVNLLLEGADNEQLKDSVWVKVLN
jgi:hypothetical protein